VIRFGRILYHYVIGLVLVVLLRVSIDVAVTDLKSFEQCFLIMCLLCFIYRLDCSFLISFRSKT